MFDRYLYPVGPRLDPQIDVIVTIADEYHSDIECRELPSLMVDFGDGRRESGFLSFGESIEVAENTPERHDCDEKDRTEK